MVATAPAMRTATARVLIARLREKRNQMRSVMTANDHVSFACLPPKGGHTLTEYGDWYDEDKELDQQ